MLVLGRELNVVQLESDLGIASPRSARASREGQSDEQHREVARVQEHRRRQYKLDDHVNIAEAIRICAPTCDVNAHLNYVITELELMFGIVIPIT
jgi:hypothetical protein